MPSFEKFEDLQDLHLVHTNDSAPSSLRTAAEKLVGTVIEQRYQLLSLIGEGGMGFVFKAKQLTTGRLVAIKMIASPDISNEQLMRFCQEAKAACAFSHPNAVAIYELFVSGGVTPYLAMQYVEGVTLSEEIERNGPLSEREAARIFAQIADALAHAHQSHVLHRDIKPSNIMLVNDMRGNRSAMLLDFGIAKLGALDGKSLNLTKTGEVVGTPYYMSPEQCQGGEADQRSDIYALGCVMYEVLTGKKAVAGENFLQALTNQVHGKIKPVSEHEAGKTVSPQMRNIIHKAIEKDPNKRFQSMSELWEGLLRLEKPSAGVTNRDQPQHGQQKLIAIILLGVILAAALLYVFSRRHAPALTGTPPPPAVASPAAPALPVVLTDWPGKYIAAANLFRHGNEKAALSDFNDVIDSIMSSVAPEQVRVDNLTTTSLCQKLIVTLHEYPTYNEFWCLGIAFQNSHNKKDPVGNIALSEACTASFLAGYKRNPDDLTLEHELGVSYEFLANDELTINDTKDAIENYKLSIDYEKDDIHKDNSHPEDLYYRIGNIYHQLGSIEKQLKHEAAAQEYFRQAEAWFPESDVRVAQRHPDWADGGVFYAHHARNLKSLGQLKQAEVLIKKAAEYAAKHGKAPATD